MNLQHKGNRSRLSNIHSSHLLSSFSRYWPLLLPLVLLLPSLNSFPYPSPSAAYSDLAVSHLTYAAFLRRAIFEAHTLPLWSSLILSGHPLAANPLSGLWYPPGWLALLLPLPLGFNLLIAAHLLWGGLGMLRLLRKQGLAPPAALFGSLTFALLPKLFAHYGAGHLTLLYAVPWTPWLLLHFQPKRSGANFNFKPSIILALIFLADPRWVPYAALLFCFYVFAQSPLNRQSLISNLHFLTTQAFLTFLLSAPLALPLVQLTSLSTRSHLAPEDIYSFSMPPARLLGLFFPSLRGFHEWVLYPGVLVLMLALLTLALYGNAPRSGYQAAHFWAWVASLSLLYSLGSNFPPLAWLGSLPGLDHLRVPSRALFITGLSLAALAAIAVDRILSGDEFRDRHRAGLLLTGLAGFSLALPLGGWMIAGKLPLDFAWGAGMLLVGVILTGLMYGKRLGARSWFGCLFILACLDLGVIDLSLFAPRKAERVMAEKQALAAYLSSQPGSFRVFSPSYSLPQHTVALAGLELADGVDPLQLETYAAFLASASGIPQAGYSVTLPPMGNGDPTTANARSLPNPALLGLLNVRYVVAEYDLPVSGLGLRGRFGDTRVYENSLSLPRAWVQPAESGPGEQFEPVQILLQTPNRLELYVPGGNSPIQRQLVLSELAYPGWRAWVDGKEVEIHTKAGLFRSVLLSPGPHHVIFAFRPVSVYGGLALSIVGVLIILAINNYSRLKNKE